MMQDDALMVGPLTFIATILLLTLAATGRHNKQSRTCRLRAGRRRDMPPPGRRHGGGRWEGTPPWFLAWLGSFIWANWAAMRRCWTARCWNSTAASFGRRFRR